MCVALVVRMGTCIPLTMLDDVCQCCRLLMFVCSPPFKTPCSLLNLMKKESEAESGYCHRRWGKQEVVYEFQ